MKGQVTWSCIYFLQSKEQPNFIKIGAARTPVKRTSELASQFGSDLVLVWYMRAHMPLGKRLVQQAFDGLNVQGDWFLPHIRLQGFVNDCKANAASVLTPKVLDAVLVKYATDDYRELVEPYRAIFDAEYKFIQSNSGKRAAEIA